VAGIQVFRVDPKTGERTLGVVPEEGLANAQPGEFEVATPEAVAEYRSARTVTPGEVAATVGEGLARGATVGLSDVAAGALAPEYAKRAGERQDKSPVLAGVSELAGTVAPLLVPGAGEAVLATRGGALAKGLAVAGAPVRALAKVGTATGRAAAGAATRLGIKSPALRGAIELGVGGTVEGAAYGAGHVLSEASLEQDYESLGEKLVAGAGEGALTGLVFGAPIGAGSAVLGGALRANKGKIGEYADQATLEAFKPGKPQLNKLTPERQARIAKTIREEGWLKEVGTDVEAQIAKAEQVIATQGDEIGKLAQQLDATAPLGTREVKDLVTRFSDLRNEYAYRGSKLGLAKAREVDSHLNALETGIRRDEFGDIVGTDHTYSSIKQIHSDIGKSTRGPAFSDADSIARDVGNKLYGRTSEFLEESIGKHLGPDALDAYSATKRRFEAAKFVERAAQEQINRGGANLAFGLTDRISGAAGFAAGVASGTPLTGLLYGATSAGLNKLSRKYGAYVVASTLDTLAQRANGATLKLSGSAKTFFRQPGSQAAAAVVDIDRHLGVKPGQSRSPAYLKVARQIHQLRKAQPHSLSEAAAYDIPETAKSASLVEKRALEFLASKIRDPAQDDNPILRRVYAEPPPTDDEIVRNTRYIAAVRDPLSLADQINSGSVPHKETVEAVKKVYPKLFEELQGNLANELVEAKEDIDYGRRVILGLYFDIEVEPSLRPDRMRMTQDAYAQQDAPQQEQRPSLGQAMKSNDKLISGFKTQIERLEQGDLENI
jgi:hypothetical protein